MAKKRSTDKSPTKLTSRATRNVYEDSDSDRSEEGGHRSRDGRGSAYDNDTAWRTDRRRGDYYGSEGSPYRSTGPDRRRERNSPHAAVHEEYYGRTGRRDHHHEGPSRLRRHRSPTPDMSFRESRVRSGFQGREYDEREGRQYSRKETYSTPRRSPTSADQLKRRKRATSSPSRIVGVDLRPGVRGVKKEKILKPIEVDGLGIPVGMMKEQFSRDINYFVKDMNPCVGYEKQKQQAKDRLQDRIYGEYEVHGEANHVDEKYIKKCATKSLITWRHALNKALDTGEGKPPELKQKYWEELERIRESEESKLKSKQMGNQARNRGLRNSTKEKIKQATLVKLVSLWTSLFPLQHYFFQISSFDYRIHLCQTVCDFLSIYGEYCASVPHIYFRNRVLCE